MCAWVHEGRGPLRGSMRRRMWGRKAWVRLWRSMHEYTSDAACTSTQVEMQAEHTYGIVAATHTQTHPQMHTNKHLQAPTDSSAYRSQRLHIPAHPPRDSPPAHSSSPTYTTPAHPPTNPCPSAKRLPTCTFPLTHLHHSRPPTYTIPAHHQPACHDRPAEVVRQELALLHIKLCLLLPPPQSHPTPMDEARAPLTPVNAAHGAGSRSSCATERREGKAPHPLQPLWPCNKTRLSLMTRSPSTT